MSKALRMAALIVAATSAAPAAALTYMMGGSTSTPNSVSITPNGTTNTLVVSARVFFAPPATLRNTSQFIGTTQLGRSSVGIGACSEGGSPGGNDCAQVDSGGLFNEALQFTFSTATSLSSLRLSMVDNNDTLRLYGLGANGTLELIGFGGNIASGLGRFASSTFLGSHDGGTYDVNFAPTPLYRTYYLTQHNDSGDGVRVNSLNAGPLLPEPGTWALMIIGFMSVGLRVRRTAALRSLSC